MSEQTPETGSPPETGEPEPQGDNGDEEGDEEAQPAPPEQPAAPPVDMEKALKALDREQVRHGRRVEEIMGADFQLYVPCIVCDTLGYNGPDVRIVEAYKYNPELGQLALVSNGAQPEDIYEFDQGVEVCATCKGFGKLRTGSRVQGSETKGCNDCGGVGWVTRTNVAPITTPAPQSKDPQAVEALRAAGYTVLPPYQATVPPS